MAKKASGKAGLPPGSLVFTGTKKADSGKIQLMDYDSSNIQEKDLKKIEDCFPFKDTPTVTWVNIVGLHDTDPIKKVGDKFELHPLVLEDILNINQRPKLDDFEKQFVVILKMIYLKKKELVIEQVSIIVGTNYVISFQEREGDVFEPIRERLRTAKGKIRTRGSDYLGYCLIDAIVDNYYIVLEELGEEIEEMEDKLLINANPAILQRLHEMKRRLIYLRKSVWPLREIINKMQRGEIKLIKKQTEIYIRDIYDHTIQIIDSVETYRDMVSGLADLYLSTVSNRMNEVMKVLTIIATIFIPLTFVTGVYGMNFEHMPELAWPWAYPVLWLIMLTIAGLMFVYFRKKKWL